MKSIESILTDNIGYTYKVNFMILWPEFSQKKL